MLHQIVHKPATKILVGEDTQTGDGTFIAIPGDTQKAMKQFRYGTDQAKNRIAGSHQQNRIFAGGKSSGKRIVLTKKMGSGKSTRCKSLLHLDQIAGYVDDVNFQFSFQKNI